MSQAKVLVIDDDDTVRTATARLLCSRGYRAEARKDEWWAFVALGFKITYWDIVILNIQLPRSDALTVIQRLVCSYPNVAVVAYSQHPNQKARYAALLAGADAFFTKPIRVDELCSILEQTLASKQAVASGTLAPSDPSYELEPSGDSPAWEEND